MTDCQCIDIHKFTNPWLAFECLGYFLGLGHHDHPIQHCKKTYQAIWRIMFLLGMVTSFGVPCEFYNSIIYLVLSGIIKLESWYRPDVLLCYPRRDWRLLSQRCDQCHRRSPAERLPGACLIRTPWVWSYGFIHDSDPNIFGQKVGNIGHKNLYFCGSFKEIASIMAGSSLCSTAKARQCISNMFSLCSTCFFWIISFGFSTSNDPESLFTGSNMNLGVSWKLEGHVSVNGGWFNTVLTRNTGDHLHGNSMDIPIFPWFSMIFMFHILETEHVSNLPP